LDDERCNRGGQRGFDLGSAVRPIAKRELR
jgi:hypothetical protein